MKSFEMFYIVSPCTSGQHINRQVSFKADLAKHVDFTSRSGYDSLI